MKSGVKDYYSVLAVAGVLLNDCIVLTFFGSKLTKCVGAIFKYSGVAVLYDLNAELFTCTAKSQ